MNDRPDTATQLVLAAKELFSQFGYDGTSVRAITARAGANLGAITYHFGSKEALYDAVLKSVTAPIREMLSNAGNITGPPLLRLEQIIRAFFHYLRDHPEFPNLMAHQLAGSHPLPAPARETIQTNLELLTSLIAEGQRDGSIRSGHPRDMALSVASQPIWLTLARRVLREGVGMDQDDPDTHQQIVESVIQFVRAGLEQHEEGQA